MTQEYINNLIDKISERQQKSVCLMNKIIHDVIDRYKKLHQECDVPEDCFAADEKNSIDIITELVLDPKWYESHDAIWRIFLELKHSRTFRNMDVFKNVNLNQLEKDIDIPPVDNIRTLYESKYLDSDELEYDGDLIICDPSILLSNQERKLCPSLYAKNTLVNNASYYIVSDENNDLIGTVCVQSTDLCVVLAKDIWNIPSANEALRMCDIDEYTFIRQFHGSIQFHIEEDNGEYMLYIEGNGNKPFKVNLLKQ